MADTGRDMRWPRSAAGSLRVTLLQDLSAESDTASGGKLRSRREVRAVGCGGRLR
jgi:hypothetical protein